MAVSGAAVGCLCVLMSMPLPAWAGGFVKWFDGVIFGIAFNPEMMPDYIGENHLPFISESRGF